MRTIFGVATMAAFLAVAGCQEGTTTQPDARTDDLVSYISADEFNITVARANDLVLLEFCVPAGCFRCDEMRGQIDRLAADQRDRLMVRRVNLNQQPALVRQHGVSVCPSYIAFAMARSVPRSLSNVCRPHRRETR